MHYKRPQDVPGGSNNGTSFMHYGDPGADQGKRRDIHSAVAASSARCSRPTRRWACATSSR
jgi:hypothetical protein